MSQGMPQLDPTSYPSQLFWLGLSFLSLYYIMSRHIVPRIHTVIENRQQRIEYDLDRAASLKSEAEQAREGYERALAEARGQAQKMLSEVSEAIRKTAESRNNELDTILSQKVQESEKSILEARMAADKQLEPTAAEVAVVLTEKILGYKPDTKAMQKLVAEYNDAAAQKLGKAA